MSLTLGIDCAIRWTNVGLADGKTLIGELNLNIGREQSSHLPSIVECLLAQCGACLADVGRIAVTNGPGYYTGIRVGLSYAAALAEGLGVNVAQVPTLRALVRDYIGSGGVLAGAVRAKRNFVFRVLCDAMSGDEIAPAAFMSSDDFIRELDRYDCVTIVTESPENFMSREGTLGITDKKHEKIIVSTGAVGGAVALLGADESASLVSPNMVRANYLREPD